MVYVHLRMRWWILIFLEVVLGFHLTDAAASVRLTGGGYKYGFVEKQIGGVWKPVCPGENDETEHLSKAACKELGFNDGIGYKMTTPVTAPDWWYNEFVDDSSEIPMLDAYITKKWINVSRTSQYSHCQTSTLTALCIRKVHLNIAPRNLLPSINERGFGRVVLSPSSNEFRYIDYVAIDDTGAHIICKELEFNFSSRISDDRVVGNGQDVQQYITDNYTCDGTENTIFDCVASELKTPLYKPAVVACSNADDILDGSARIGPDQSLVEIRYYNTWGLICGDNFTDTDARVLCTSMGFNDGKAGKMSGNNLRRLYPVWIKSLNCDSSKTKVVDCNKEMWDSRCNNLAQARCFNTDTEGAYTLTNGGGILGRHFIQRSSKNQYGKLAMIKDKRLSDNNPAAKLCKILGYTSGTDVDLPGPTTLPQVKYWLGVYISSGSECITADECFKDDWTLTGDLSKIRDYVKMITCYNKVYLNGNGISGMVTYRASDNSQPFTINDATISTDEVNLICKDIGFPNGGRKITEKLYASQNDGSMVSMNCPSDASSLNSCTFPTIADTNNLVPSVLACNLPNNLPDGIYLGDEGEVNINQNNIPVQFCIDDKGWTDKEASVACRELGFTSFNYYTKSRGDYTAVGYKSVTCHGNEQLLSQCTLEASTSTNCYKVAAVTCYNPDDTKFELRDGGDRYGRVWVTRGDKQGYFCPEKFDEEDASTVCRELGFKGGDEIKMPPVTTSGTKWWNINTNCDDDTQVIEGCEGGHWKYVAPTSSVTDNSCSWKTASVYCFSNVYLDEAPYLSYGAVRKTGTKTRFSSDSFGSTEANIACKEMGFSQGGKVIPSTSFKKRDDPIIVKCNGNEASLLECPVKSGTVDDNKFASVACETGESIPAEGTLKIIDDSRVLVVRNGIWGGLCADSWTDNDATVVCKQLKGATSGKALKRGSKLDVKYTNFKEAWTCAGSEINLKNCNVDQSLEEKYCRESAGVFCDNYQAEATQEQMYPTLPGFTSPTDDMSGSSTPATTQDNHAASTQGCGLIFYSLVLVTTMMVFK